MAVTVHGFNRVGMVQPGLAKIDVGMLRDSFGEVVVQQWPEGWQEQDIEGDDYGNQKHGRCPVAFATVTLTGFSFSGWVKPARGHSPILHWPWENQQTRRHGSWVRDRAEVHFTHGCRHHPDNQSPCQKKNLVGASSWENRSSGTMDGCLFHRVPREALAALRNFRRTGANGGVRPAATAKKRTAVATPAGKYQPAPPSVS